MEYPVLVGINCDHCQACKTLIQNTKIVLYPLTTLQGHRPPPSTEPLLPQHPTHLFVMEEGWNCHRSAAVSTPTSAAAQTFLSPFLEIPRQTPLVLHVQRSSMHVQPVRAHWDSLLTYSSFSGSCCCHSHQEWWQVQIPLHTVALWLWGTNQ